MISKWYLIHASKSLNAQALTNHVSAWSGGAQYMFLERLFDAFDLDGNHRIDLNEFISGLSVFFKGTPEEKSERNQFCLL